MNGDELNLILPKFALPHYICTFLFCSHLAFSLQNITSLDEGPDGKKSRMLSILISANQIHKFGSSQSL